MVGHYGQQSDFLGNKGSINPEFCELVMTQSKRIPLTAQVSDKHPMPSGPREPLAGRKPSPDT